jgi:hypothetical protein
MTSTSSRVCGVQDAWAEFNRHTYLHDDDADPPYLKALGAAFLRRAASDCDSYGALQEIVTLTLIEQLELTEATPVDRQD